MNSSFNPHYGDYDKNKRNIILASILLLLIIIVSLALWANRDNGVEPEPVSPATPAPFSNDFVVRVDGMEYNNKTELTLAVGSATWKNPKFACWENDVFMNADFYRAERGIDDKYIDEETGEITNDCYIYTTSPTDRLINEVKDPDFVSEDRLAHLDYTVSVFPFNEYVMMKDKLNDSVVLLEPEYFFYTAMDDYNTHMFDIKLFNAAGIDIEPMSVDEFVRINKVMENDSVPELKIKTEDEEEMYRNGWEYAELVSLDNLGL